MAGSQGLNFSFSQPAPPPNVPTHTETFTSSAVHHFNPATADNDHFHFDYSTPPPQSSFHHAMGASGGSNNSRFKASTDNLMIIEEEEEHTINPERNAHERFDQAVNGAHLPFHQGSTHASTTVGVTPANPEELLFTDRANKAFPRALDFLDINDGHNDPIFKSQHSEAHSLNSSGNQPGISNLLLNKENATMSGPQTAHRFVAPVPQGSFNNPPEEPAAFGHDYQQPGFDFGGFHAPSSPRMGEGQPSASGGQQNPDDEFFKF